MAELPFQQVRSAIRGRRPSGYLLYDKAGNGDVSHRSRLYCARERTEAAAHAVLLECAGTFSPRVEDQSSDSCFTCVIDIAGTETLFGSPDALGESLLKKIHALGIRASIAISSNFHAARCLARGHLGVGVRVVPRGMECAALAPLALGVLDLSPEHEETFSMWGIATLGALGNLEETELIARLGQTGKELRLLARGESPHLFTPLEADFSLEERMDLDTPVELLDSLLFILGVMLDQLIVRAQARILALASITLHLDLEGGLAHTCTVRPALPNIDRKLWLKLIHLDLQAHPPQGAILALTLSAQPGSTSKVRAAGLFSLRYPSRCCSDVTLARIRSNIVGERAACGGRRCSKILHRPDAFRVEPFLRPSFFYAGKRNPPQSALPCDNCGHPKSSSSPYVTNNRTLSSSERSDTPSSVLTGPGLPQATGGSRPSGRSSNGIWSRGVMMQVGSAAA